MDSLYFATITENTEGHETYSTPQILAKAIKADLSIELAEAVLHADDGVVYSVKEFQAGTLKLGIADQSPATIATLTGAHVDDNGVLISTSEDGGATVAIGFRAKKPEEVWRYFWLYKCKFGIPSIALETKDNSISFKTPELEGTVMRRNKPDSRNRKPWKAEVTEGDPGVSSSTISSWFTSVYEPVDAPTT